MRTFSSVRARAVRGLLLASSVLVLYFVVPVDAEASATRVLVSTTVTGCCLAVAAVVVQREVRRDREGAARSLDGGQLVALFFLVVAAFALTYFSLAVHARGQMVGIETRVDALYFATTTMTTVGYGDIHPVGQAAKLITIGQLAFDVVFIATFARLVRTR